MAEVPINDCGERNVVLYLFYLDSDHVTEFRFWNDHYVATIHLRDAISLVANTQYITKPVS